MINPQRPELLLSTNFHGPKDVWATEVRLFTEKSTIPKHPYLATESTYISYIARDKAVVFFFNWKALIFFLFLHKTANIEARLMTTTTYALE